MKKITILALHLGYGGVEKYISSLCKMLGDDYNIKIIVTYRNKNGPAFEFNSNIDIEYLINDVPHVSELKKSIKNKKIFLSIKLFFLNVKLLVLKYIKNIFTIIRIKSDYIITTRIFHNRLVNLFSNKKIIKIATEHNYHNNNKRYIRRLIKSVNNFDYLVLVSKELCRFYSNKILGNPKCIYIPNSIDSIPFDNTDLNENIIINIGRLEQEKGQEDLIDVFKLVCNRIKDAKLYIVGDGSLKENLKLKAELLGIKNNIVFTGFINQDEIKKLLLKTKLYVMTSFTESFGIVLIESMSYGVPCIAFDSSSGARELLKNSELVKNRDKELLACKICELLLDYDRLKLISKDSKNRVYKYSAFRVKKMWKQILK